MTTVGEVAAALERHYPLHLAEDWDAVGLAVGSAGAEVTRITYTVDVTVEVLGEAADAGTELVVAHHPPLLRGLRSVTAEHPKGRLVAEALGAGLAVYVAHTNADVPPRGVADALAGALGVQDTAPLRPRRAPEAFKLVTFVPPDHLEAVIDALAAAGAGVIGDYERCAYTGPGSGTFRPLPGAEPYLGSIGTVQRVTEARLEMVLPGTARAAVVAALLAAHPYQTPAFDLYELAGRPSPDTGLGRVGRLAVPTTLAGFADRVVAALPATAGGLRVAGDPGRPVVTVAVQAGAGDDLLDEARRCGADVYLTSDLRHHPAAEALAWPGAPALVDVPHWAAEWPWLPVVRDLVESELGVPGHVSTLRTDPWSARR